MKFNNKFAFSVAEMLMALLVIGIVIMIYMPTLNSSFKKNVTQATLADAIKNFNQALYNYSQQQSCHGSLSCTDLFSAENNLAGSRLISVFDSSDSQTNNCWKSNNISNPNTDLSNYSCTIDAKDVIFATQRLSNCSTNTKVSTTYDIKDPATGAITNSGNNVPERHKLQKTCGYVYIDTNGTKAPNQFGKDVYIFVITDGAPSYLYPVGGAFWEDTTNFNGIGRCPADGRACASNFVENRSKINFW